MKAVHTATGVSPNPEVDSSPNDESPSPQERRPDPAAIPAGPEKDRVNAGPEARGAGEASRAKPGHKKDAKEGRAAGEEGTRAGGPAYTGSVSAIGDSVMLGAVGRLQKEIRGLAVVDAEVGMQVYTAIDILRARQASGQLGEVVIVHLGNNGTFTAGQFDEIMRVLSGVDRVVFVNVKVPRAWERSNNEVISAGVQRYPNAVLVDWYSGTINSPELFYGDGFHLRPRGQRAYADMVSMYLTGP